MKGYSNMKDIIGKNIRLYVLLGVIILFGVIGVTLAIVISNFNAIAINSTTLNIDANVTYDSETAGSTIISNGNMLPINDSLIIGPGVTDTRVLKVIFYVSGVETNPDNTVYDIALHNINIDCELRSTDLKWRLYKENNLISEGNLSPTFDTMARDRLVLTNTEEDLTTAPTKYTFLLWISESCTGNIAECDSTKDQSKYFNKALSADIKVELATRSKKQLVRVTGSENSCNYAEVEVPLCNNLVYNASAQTLISNGSNYTLVNNTGTDAAMYTVTAKLNDGYKWKNGSTADLVLNCSIEKKDVTVVTLDQNINYGQNISNTASNIRVDGLLTGHTIRTVALSSDKVDIGEGLISLDKLLINDENGNDVTNNYSIKKNNNGRVTIKCSNLSIIPDIANKVYSGSEQIGVTGGNYIEISGDKSATEVGEYKVMVVPQKNYCWSDGTTDVKEYTWNITENMLNIVLSNKTVNYTGNIVTADAPTITDSSGTVLTNIPISYEYFNGNSCSGTIMTNKPLDVGSYSVRAYSDKYSRYSASESNCAKLDIIKADASMTISSSDLTLIYPTDGSFTYTYTGDGTISCSSSSTSIATCSVDTANKKVTVTPVATGSATITVSASEGTNYNATSKNVSVTVNNGALSGGSVKITGTNTYNQTLTASVTDTSPAGTYAYQWYSNTSNSTSGGTAISGATSSTYKIGSGLVGKYIYVVVTASQTNYTSKTFSDITDATANTTATVARASANMGVNPSSLTLTYPTTGSFTYTYTGDGTISCSSSATSVATCSVDTTNKKVTVTPVATGTATITLSASQGTNYNATSKNVSVTVNNGTLSGGSVKITGTNTYNQTLTASVTDTSPAATYTYQWYSNTSNSTSRGTAISGATSSTYKIGSGLIGKYIYVIVTASKSNYTSKTFSDITDATANTTATVVRASASMSVSSTSLSLTYPTAGSFTYTYTGDGSISCSSSSTSIATCSVDTANKKVTVTPVAKGSATITLSAAQGTNYNAISKTVSVTVSYIEYTITYNANGGSGAPSSQTKIYGKTLTLSSTKPSRSGHTFLGWSTSSTATSATYSAGGSYTANSAATLYAVWATNVSTSKTYIIRSYKDSNYVMDVEGNKTDDETNVDLWTYNGDINQKWYFSEVSTGVYNIIAKNSDKCLDIYEGVVSMANGKNVQLYTCGTGNNQRWKINYNSDGSITFLSVMDTSYAVDVKGGTMANGTNINIHTSNNTGAQKWKLEEAKASTFGEEYGYTQQTMTGTVYSWVPASNCTNSSSCNINNCGSTGTVPKGVTVWYVGQDSTYTSMPLVYVKESDFGTKGAAFNTNACGGSSFGSPVKKTFGGESYVYVRIPSGYNS